MRTVVLQSAPALIGDKSKSSRLILRSYGPTDAGAIFLTMAETDYRSIRAFMYP